MNTSQTTSDSVSGSRRGILNRYFHLNKRGTSVWWEIRGGVVMFFAMAYILVLNPITLPGTDSAGKYLGGGSELDAAAIVAGTALVADLVMILTGAIPNFPLALAAGLGLNSMVAGMIVKISGMTWTDGMGVIVIEGVVIVFLVLTGLREAIFHAVSKFLHTVISVGIGLFVAFVGLVDAGIVHKNGEGETAFVFGVNGLVSTRPLIVFTLGLALAVVLVIHHVKGTVLIGIISTTVLAVAVKAVRRVGPRSGDNPGGWGLTIPSLKGSPIQTPGFSTLGEFSTAGPFAKIDVVTIVILTFSVMLASFFDTVGTMVAVGAEGDLLDDAGDPPNTQRILLVDSLTTIAGGAGGVSSSTSYIEPFTGVADGMRTGLASVAIGITFLLSTFFAPLAVLVPNEAVTLAFVAIGFLMMQRVVKIDWTSLGIVTPAFPTIVFMPFGYSITVGIGVDFVCHCMVETARGRVRKVHPLVWLVNALFAVYFLLGPIQRMLDLI